MSPEVTIMILRALYRSVLRDLLTGAVQNSESKMDDQLLRLVDALLGVTK